MKTRHAQIRPNITMAARRPWRRPLRISRSPRAVYRLLSLSPMGAAVAAMAGLPAITAWAQASGNVIKPDGRTATQQQVQGTRTDITTGTVRGDNGFNSFSRFEVGQGQTVNVHVPTQAQRVINIVTDAPIKVDGVLNGLKDGSLSGNLVFADPMGMVVSRSGVINVNSLQVVAPTRAHMDAMLDGSGRIGDVAVKQLLDGQAPRSEDGRVRIDGRINALERVRIEARRIDVDGRIKAGADAAHDAAFRSAVSSNGLSQATGMVERGGVIELVADDGIKLQGTLDASQRQAPAGAAPAIGGTVTLQAREIELGSDSLVDVSGLHGGGIAVLGTMSLPELAPVSAAAAEPVSAAPLTENMLVAKGSQVLADAVERGDGGRVQYLSAGSMGFGGFAGARGGALLGNGGFVEVSGRRRLQFYGLVDTRAPKGLTGTLLIDPDDLSIVNGVAGDSACLGTTSTGDCNITTGTVLGLAAANNLVLQANDSITLGDSAGNAATLDLSAVYQSGSSGIAFTSENIYFNSGSKLITGGGFVKLIALGGQDTGDLGSGEFKYSNSVGLGPLTIGKKIQGGTIHLKSGSAVITRGVAAGDAASAALSRNAGDVTLRAGTVQLDAGSQVLAQAETGSGFSGGAVEITGYALEQYHLGKATASSQVTLAGTIRADRVAVNSVAQAEASPDGVFGYAVSFLQQSLGALTGLGAGYHDTQADAKIDVQGTALIEAKTTLDLAAASFNKSAGSVKVYTLDEKDNNLAALAALYVRTGGIADVTVKSGAQLKSGGKTTVGAYNDATAKADVNILSNNAIGGAALSYLSSDVSSNAQIDAGAVLNVAALDLVSLQTGNMRNTALAKIERREAKPGEPPPPDAAIGATVAISDIHAHSSATLGASLSGVGDVSVIADTSLWQNMTSARNAVVPVGAVDKVKIAVVQKFQPFGNLQSKLTSWLSDKFDALGSLKSGSPPIKAGATVTVNETDLGSKARIGNGATISSGGNVAVVAQTEDRSIHNISDSKVNTKESTEAKPAISAAVAVGLYEHDAQATVGEGATISAKNFGLQAQVYQPLDVTWLGAFSVDGLKNPAELMKHFTPPNFGMPQFVFTSWASSLAEQEPAENSGGQENTAAVAGAVNWTSFKNNAKSWVGAGAKITASAGDQAWSVGWTSPKAPLLDGDSSLDGEAAPGQLSNILVETGDALDQVKGLSKNLVGEITGFFNGKPVVIGVTLDNSASFSKAIDVKAHNQSAFLTFTGQPIDIGFSGVKIGVQGGPVAVGGAFNYAGAEHTTVAGIDDGAIVRATLGTLSVDAESQDRIIAIAPTAGKGKGSVVNLIAAYSQLDNTTVAVLSNKADVRAGSLQIKAVEDVSVWSAAGAAAFGASAAAVGVAVAVNELDGRTLATIADPDSLAVGAVRPDGFQGRTAVGTIDAAEVRVQGITQGTSGAIAASAASVSSEDQSKADDQVKEDDKSAISKKWEGLKTKTSDLRNKVAGKISGDDGGKVSGWRSKLADKIADKQVATVPPKPPKQSSISLAAAGSATVNLGNLDTSSIIDSAALANSQSKAAGAADTSLVLARAHNDTHQYSVSGSLALLKLNAPESKTGYGVSGAIAIDMEDNDTLARVVGSSIKDYGHVAVESLAAGQRIAVGLGIAGSSGSKPSYMLSASFSMTESDNSTISAIDGGSITGSDSFRSAVEVLAYDRTETGVGAGALTVQGNKGGAAGASIGVALVHNEVEARVAGVQASKLATLDARAYDPVVLGIGAASLGISTEQNSTTLEGSVTYGEIENSTRAFVGDGLVGGVLKDSQIEASGKLTVQATDVVPTLFKDRFNAVLAAGGTPAADSDYDFGASLRSGSQEGFGGQSIGSSQPGSLVIGVAGGIAVGSGNSVGAAVAASRVANVHEALIEGASVTADGVTVDATDAALLVNIGIGVAGTSSKVALAGSAAITIDENRATARIGSSGKSTSVTTQGNDGLAVTAATSERAFAVAGSVGISTQGSAGGIAGTVGVSAGVAEAGISNASITTSKAQVLGSTASQHVSVAAAGGYGANASINGSFVINFSTERTSASVADSTITADSLAVKAGDAANLAAQVYTGAGSIGFSKDVAGGAALTSNTVALTREAVVDRSTLTLGNGADALDVQADSSVKMIGVTVAGGGGGQVAFNGAISANEIANRTTARVAGNQLGSDGDVRVIAGDRSEMNYGTGAISVSGQAAIGAAIGFNLISNDVTAQLQGSDSNGQYRGSGALSAGNVRVSASSDERIVNAAYGVAIGSQVGGAGSIAVNVIDTDVSAHIGRGANLRADGSVVVEATGQDDIKSFGGALGIGSSAGIGLSSTVNVVRGATTASVGADDEVQVQIDAQGNGAGLAVNSGTLEKALPGLSAAGTNPKSFDGFNAMQSYDATRAKLAETQTTVKGLSVNATSLRHVLSFDTTLGVAGEGVGIGANAGAHVISSGTVAEIANASVNQRDAGAAAQDVAVKSTSHHVMATFGFGLGAGLAGGGTAALGGDVFLTDTRAQIRDSQLRAQHDVSVRAGNESAQSSLLVGFAGGSVAAAGTAGVVVFDGVVQASILGGQTRAEHDVAVEADNAAVLNVISGAGALSAGPGAAGAVTVVVSDTQTEALIGRADGAAGSTRVSTGGDLEVLADSSTAVNTLTVAVSGGGGISGAAIGAVAVVTNATTAAVRKADLEVGVAANWVHAPAAGGGTDDASEGGAGPSTVSGPAGGSLTISASDHGVITQGSGAAGLGFGGGGVGGTVSVLVTRSNVSAELSGSEVDAKDVAVQSLNHQEHTAATVGVGVGDGVGAGFAISLMMLGTGSPDAEAFDGDQAKGSQLMTAAVNLAKTSRLGETGDTLTAAQRSQIQAESTRDLGGTLKNSGANSAAANVGASTVRAAGNVVVKAEQESALENVAGAAGVGLAVGAGGSVGVSYVHNATVAQVSASTITAAGSLDIGADSRDVAGKSALDLTTIAGGVGFAGLGASVGVGHLQNTVLARASGSLSAQHVNVAALDSTSANVENVAAAAGGGALGVAVSTLERTGSVNAWVNQAGAGGQSVTAQTLDITAEESGSASVVSRAVAAGLAISGNGAAGTIKDTMSVTAGIGNHTAVHVSGDSQDASHGTTVLAQRSADLDGRAEGVGVSGGVQLGGSVALVELGGETVASVGTAVQFDAGGALAVAAEEHSGNSLSAKASASGGGWTAALNASVATADNHAQVRASIGDDTWLPNADVTLLAKHAATQSSDASGVTVGGLLAIGANVAETTTTARTEVTLGNVRTAGDRLGDLSVAALGDDTSHAKAMAGGGGLISGQAAVAKLSDKTTTLADISAWGAAAQANPDDYTLRAGQASLQAEHQAQFRSESDTVNASVVGGSGAIASSTVDNRAKATLGDDVRLRALGIGIASLNDAKEIQGGDNASGAGGGLANGSAVQVKTHFDTASTAEVGERAMLDVIGDPTSDNAGRLVVTAATDLLSNSQGSLNTGGLIDVPFADVEAISNGHNLVTVGAGASLRSVGDLVLGTTTLNRMRANSVVKTYGAVSVAGGTTLAKAQQSDAIDVGADALLHAYGNVSVSTGRNALGGLNLVSSNAETDVYNYTAVPITTTNAADAVTSSVGAVNLAAGSRIEAGRSVFLRNFKGDQSAQARGEGHNPYLELFSTSTDDSDASQTFVGSVALNGQVTAGYYRLRDMSIDAAGALTQTTDLPALQLPVVTFTMDASGQYRNAANQVVDAGLVLKPQGYIAKVDGFNPSFYYDDNAKSKLGGVPDKAMGAYVLPDLFVAGGSIEVNATLVSGNGLLRAQGGPLIQVSNASNRYLIGNKMVMPDEDSGGAVVFAGSGSKPASLAVQEVDKGRVSSIKLLNSFDPSFGGDASDIIFQSGSPGEKTVRNPRGSFQLINSFGNVWGSAPDALTVDIQVPQGTYVLESDGYVPIGGSPQNEWAGVDATVRPGSVGDLVDTAAYAYYVKVLGRGEQANDYYSKDLQGILNDKGSGIAGYLFRKNLGNVPGQDHALDWYESRYEFDRLPTKALSGSQANAKPASNSPGLTANRVDITAKYLDINAPIRAGTARDVDVTIHSNKLYRSDYQPVGAFAPAQMSFFECVAIPTCRAINKLYAEANGLYKVPLGSLQYGASSPLVTVMFDAANGRLSTSGIGSASVGSVSLVGHILNSNANAGGSKIELATGTLKVSLNNKSGYEIDLPRIETGSSGKGVIRITDLGQTAVVYNPVLKKNVAAPLTTWYVSADGTNVEMYQDRLATDYSGLTAITGSAVNGATTSSYSPAAGWRYEWTRSAKATRQLVNPGTGAWWDWYATDWEYAGFSAGSPWQLKSSGVVYDPGSASVNYKYSLASNVGFNGVNVGYSYHGAAQRTWYVATSATLNMSSSVKADFGIGISFKGYASGSVDIASNANAHLAKSISNGTGDTRITLSGNAQLLGHDGGLIKSRNLALQAGGSIGGDGNSQALDVQLDGGQLSAKAGGHLAVNALGDLVVAQAEAGRSGTLRLQAVGDLRSAGDNVVLKGYQIDLHSSGGRIGGAGAGDAMKLELFNIGNAAIQRGVLKAEANDGINLSLSGGDVRVDSVKALDGDVKIATDGSLFDYKEGAGAVARSADDLLALWEGKLRISGDRAESVKDTLTHTIAPLDQQVNRDYRAYWDLRALGSLGGDGRLALSAKGLATLRAQTAAALGTSNPSDAEVNGWANELLGRYTTTFDTLLGKNAWKTRAEFQARNDNYRFSADRYNEYWQLVGATDTGRQLTVAGRAAVRAMAATVLGGSPSDAQLQAYVDRRFGSLALDFSAGLGAGWANQAAFQSYDAAYHFAADAALLNLYANGSYWGQEKLENSVRLAALGNPGGGGTGGVDHLNISGRKVEISSSAAKASLGRDNGYRTITLGQTLSDDDRYALSLASAPGDVQTLTNSAGAVTGLLVRDNRPFFVSASEQLDAHVKGQLFVQAQGALVIGQIQSDGRVRLLSQDGITLAANSTAPAISGSALVLDGGQGGLGTALTPLQIKTPELSLAKASEGIYLVQTDGSLTLDLVASNQDVEIQVLKGSLLQKQPDLLSLSGHHISLRASGDIGSEAASGGHALHLETKGDGSLRLDAQSAWISASGQGLNLGDSTLSGQLGLTTVGTTGLLLAGDVQVDRQAQLLVGGAFASVDGKKLQAREGLALTALGVTMGLGSELHSADGRIAINSTAADALLGSLSAGTGITLDAELGQILANAADVKLEVLGAGGLLAVNSLNSGGLGIGSELLPLQLAADKIALRSGAGDIHATLLNSRVELQRSTADLGSLLLQAKGAVLVSGDVTAADRLDLRAQGDFELAAATGMQAGNTLSIEAARLAMAADGLLSSTQAGVSLTATQGDALLGDVQGLSGISVDAAQGRILGLAGTRLSASGPAALVALNAKHSGGLGVGEAGAPLVVDAARVSAGSASGGIYLQLPAALTQVERAVGGVGAIELRADGALQLSGPVASEGAVTVLALGALSSTDRIEALGTGNPLLLQAASLDLAGPLSAGGDATLISDSGALRVRSSLRAGGSASLSSAAAMQLQDVEAAQDITIAADGPVDGQRVVAGRQLTVLRAPEFSLGELRSGSDMSLTLGNARIAVLGVGGDLLLQADSATLGRISIGRGASMAVGGGLDIGGGSVGGSLSAQAAGIGIGGLSVGGNASLDAGSISIGALSVGGSADLNAGGINALNLDVGGALDLGAGQAELGSVSVGGTATLQAGAGLTMEQGRFGGNLNVAAGTARLGDVEVGGPALIDVDGRLDIGRLWARQNLTLTADSLDADLLRASGALDLRARLADVAELRGDADALLTIGETVLLDRIEVGGRLHLRAATARIGDLNVGGATLLDVSRSLSQTGQGKLGGSLQASAPEMSLGALDVAGAVQLRADSLQARALQLGSTLDLQTQNAALGALSVKGRADLQTSGALRIAQGQFDDVLSIKSRSLEFGEVRSGGAASELVIGELAVLGRFEAAGRVDLAADEVSAALLKVGGALSLKARNAGLAQAELGGPAELMVAERLRIEDGKFGSTLNASAATLELGQVQIGGDALLKAGGLLKAQRLEVGGQLTAEAAQLDLGAALLAQPAADPAPAPALLVAGAMSLRADSLTLGNAEVGGDALLVAREGLTTLGSSRFGAALRAEADSMAFDALSVGGRTELTSTTRLVAGRLDTGGPALLQAEQLQLGQLNAQGPLELRSQGLTLAGLQSGGDLNLVVANAADIGRAELAGKASLQVGTLLRAELLSAAQVDVQADRIDVGALSASEQLLVRARQDLLADRLTGAQSAQLQAGGAITARLVEGSNVSLQATRDITLDLLTATQAEISTPTQIALREGRIADSVVFTADRIQAGLQGGAVLRTSVGGQGGAAASEVNLSLASSSRWVLPSINAVNAQFSSAGSWVQMDQAVISGLMTLRTPNGLIAMDNDQITAVPGADVQLYAPSDSFVLLRDRQYVYTTALALIYKPGQFVSAPNTLLSPLITTQLSTGFSPTAGRIMPSLSPRVLAGLDLPLDPLDPEQLLRQNPTASGQEEELVGSLEF